MAFTWAKGLSRLCRLALGAKNQRELIVGGCIRVVARARA